MDCQHQELMERIDLVLHETETANRRAERSEHHLAYIFFCAEMVKSFIGYESFTNKLRDIDIATANYRLDRGLFGSHEMVNGFFQKCNEFGVLNVADARRLYQVLQGLHPGATPEGILVGADWFG